MRIATALLVVTIFSSGCIPIAAHYFEPSGPGIIATKGGCNGTVGFPEYADVVLGNQKLTIVASRDVDRILSRRPLSEHSIFITISFVLKPGQSVSFDPTTIKTTDTHGNNLSLLRNPQVVIWKGSYPPEPTPSDVTSRFTYSNIEDQQNGYEAVSLYFEFEANDLKEFYFIPSQVNFSGAEYTLTPVLFREVFDSTIFPLNC